MHYEKLRDAELKTFAEALGWTEYNLIFLFNYPNQQTEMNCPESQC